MNHPQIEDGNPPSSHRLHQASNERALLCLDIPKGVVERVGERVGYRMVDRVICLSLPLVRTLSPTPPHFIEARTRGVTSAKISFRSLCTPLYTLSRWHCVYRPSSKVACSVPCIKFLNADVTPLVLPSFFLQACFPTRLRVSNFISLPARWSSVPLRGPVSDPRIPHSNHSPTMPPSQLPRRVAPLPFDPCATI